MSASGDQPTSQRLVADIIDNGAVSGQQILVILICMLFNTLDGFDITAMAVVAGAVSSELQLAPDKLGLTFSAALAGMMVGAMFLAPISDLVGRRRVIVTGILVVAVSILLTARAEVLTEFILLRFVSGLGAGALIACQATLVAEYSPEKYRALSVAAVVSGYPLGAMLTSVAAGFLLPEYGWRGMFLFGGGVTLLFGVIGWLLVPESLKFLLDRRPPDALDRVNKILRKLKKEPLQQLPPAEQAQLQSSQSGLWQTLRKLLAAEHATTTLTLWTTFFLCFATLYFLMSWVPKLMDDSGFEASVGRRAFFLFNLGGVIGIYLMGLMSTRWKLTNIVFGLLFASSIGMVIFALLPNQLNLMLAIIFLIGVLQQGGFTGLYSAAAKAYPTEIRSTGIGWAVGLGRSGAVVGPAVAGYLIAAGLDMAQNFIVFAVPMAIGGLVAYKLHIR